MEAQHAAQPETPALYTTCRNTTRTPLPATGVRQVNEESLPTVRTHTADDGLPPERMTRYAVRFVPSPWTVDSDKNRISALSFGYEGHRTSCGVPT